MLFRSRIDPRLITAWLNLASAYTMQQEDAKAVQAARQAVELDPDSGMAHNNLAVALYFSGAYQEALHHLERARELGYSVDPRFSDGLKAKALQ